MRGAPLMAPMLRLLVVRRDAVGKTEALLVWSPVAVRDLGQVLLVVVLGGL
jgi:hypothetical protein